MTIQPPSVFARLARSRSGVAATEFALVLPFLLSVGLMGIELGNRALTQMQISQLAIQVADNASRIGEQSVIEDRKIYEQDINDLLHGAALQAGGLELLQRGRIIISSLEVVPDTTDQQYIHWQRCLGLNNHASSYGEEGDGLDTGLTGMGPAGEQVTAFEGEAVMFVEIAYDYRPIVDLPFGLDHDLTAIASFTVREDRDLSQIYQYTPAAPVANCSDYTGTSLVS